jgi:hypothetical protein
MIAKKDGCAKEKRGIKRPLAYGKAEKSPRYRYRELFIRSKKILKKA